MSVPTNQSLDPIDLQLLGSRDVVSHPLGSLLLPQIGAQLVILIGELPVRLR